MRPGQPSMDAVSRIMRAKSALGNQAEYYDIEIKNTLEQAQRDILEVEGCPISLRKKLKGYNGLYVILRSKLLRCQHIMLWDALEALPSNHTVGLKSYCTFFFHCVRMSDAEFQKAAASLPNDPPSNNRLCSLEIRVCHLLTDKEDTVVTPMRMSSLLDHRMNKDFLFLSFAQAGQGSTEGRPNFSLKRGRMHIRVHDHTHNIKYEHNSNYDLTQRILEGGRAYRLVLMDNATKNCLSMVVDVTKQDLGEGFMEDTINIVWVRYTFGGIQQTASPLLGVHSPVQSPVTFPDLTNSPLHHGVGVSSPFSPPMPAVASPSIMPQQQMGAHMTWLRTPGSQVLNGPAPVKRPGGGIDKGLNKMGLKNQYSGNSSGAFLSGGPDTLFNPALANSPIHSGLAGYRGMPHMTLNSPAVMPHSHQTTQSPMYPYGSPNYNYLQAMSPVMDPRGLGGGHHLLQSPAMAMTPVLTGQMSNMNLGPSQAGGSPMLPSMSVPGGGGPPPMQLPTSVVTERGAAAGLPLEARGANVLQDMSGKVVMFAKSQRGSRFVQEKLKDPLYFNTFYTEMKNHVDELMMDNFGHYAIEALFSQCTDEQRLHLVQSLAPHIATVACHKQGSFSIQAMMDTLRTQTQINLLVEALSKHVMQIILNCSGHYVILRFLSKFGYPYTRFVHRALVSHCYEFSTDHYGLRVMKAAVDAGPQSQLTNVFQCIVKHTNTLVENQYGNYIVQHLLDVCPPSITNTIKEKMQSKYVRYSKQKFSSNVVEKCLRQSDKHDNMVKGDAGSVKNEKDDEPAGGVKDMTYKDWRQIIVRELCSKAGELISDKYGNYCLQTALQSATRDPELLGDFTASVTPHLESLRENVKAKWIKLLETAQHSSQGVGMGQQPNKRGQTRRRRGTPDRRSYDRSRARKPHTPDRGQFRRN